MSVCSPEWQCFSSFYQSYCISSCSRTMCVCLCVRASLFCMWAYYYSPCVARAIRLITFQSPLYVSLTHTSFLFIQCTTSSFLTLQSALPLSFLPHCTLSFQILWILFSVLPTTSVWPTSHFLFLDFSVSVLSLTLCH